MIPMTDELLEELGRQYEDKKTKEIWDGVYEDDTFVSFIEREMRKLVS